MDPPSPSPPRAEIESLLLSRTEPSSPPRRSVFVRNPVWELPALTDAYPCAEWFNGPTPIPYLRRYEEYVRDIVHASECCCWKCGRRTCWRIVPHVELPDFCDEPTFSAMKRYAARDTTEFLRFVRLFATSNELCDRCECYSCELRADEEYSAIASRINRPNDFAPLPDAVGWCIDRTESERMESEPCRTATMLGTLNRSSAILECLTPMYHRVEQVGSKIRLWHTRSLCTALSLLLPTLAIDAYAIEETFASLMRMGAVNIAHFFGLYANANQQCRVWNELYEFMVAHRKAEINRCRCEPAFIACAGNLRSAVPRSCQRAYRVLAVARGFNLGECRESWWLDCLHELDVRKVAIALNAVLGMDEPVRSAIFPQLYVDGSVQKLERLAVRSYLRWFGLGPPRTGSLPPRLHAVVERLGEQIVEYCRDAVFDREN